MIITSEKIKQIISGNIQARNSLFNDLEIIIDILRKKYSFAFSDIEITKMSIDIFNDAINEYGLSYQNFELLFSNKLTAKMENEIAIKIKNDLSGEIISLFINQGEQKELLNEVYDQIYSVCLLLSKTNNKNIDDFIDYLLVYNERIRNYLKIISNHDNSKNDNIIFNKLLTKYRKLMSNQELEKYDDSYRIYLNDILQYPLLSHQETLELFEKYLAGDLQAKEMLINSNLRLSTFVARKYTNRGLDIMDIIQEGNLGLVRAVEKYDPSKGFRFSTFAHLWIQHKIIRGIATQSRNIAIPVHLLDEYYRNLKKIKNKEIEIGRPLSYDEKKSLLDISDELMHVYEYFVETNTISINIRIGDGEDAEFGDLILDENSLQPQKNILDTITNKKIEEFILNSSLKAFEKRILLLRYGFINEKVYTLDSIGKIYGVCRERIRQIEKKALDILKAMPEFMKLIDTDAIKIDTILSDKNKNKNKRPKFSEITASDKFPLCKEEELSQIRKYLNPNYLNLIPYLSHSDQTILSLKLGLYNKNCFDNLAISRLLNINENQVEFHVKNALWILETLYKEKYGEAYKLK